MWGQLVHQQDQSSNDANACNLLEKLLHNNCIWVWWHKLFCQNVIVKICTSSHQFPIHLYTVSHMYIVSCN